jgi:hypothetical protein
MIRDLTETDPFKRIGYGSSSSILERENLPDYFYTQSSSCFVTNYWNSSDPVFQALESRGEIFILELDWQELHQDVATWFWDQEIFDFIQDRLQLLREPDARIYVKAWERKQSRLRLTPWQSLVDGYCDDRHGRIIRTLIGQDFPSDNQRFQAYLEMVEQTGANEQIRPLARSNFYARVRGIRAYMPLSRMPKIKLVNTRPPEEVRPADGLLPRPRRSDGEDDDSGEGGAEGQTPPPSTAPNANSQRQGDNRRPPPRIVRV